MMVQLNIRIPHTTLSQEAHRALRSAILNRNLSPGSKLIVRILAEQLGLSPTPIKEALAVLTLEGLVVAVPHRGYFIPQISPRDIEEIYGLREVVEGLAARLAAQRADTGLTKQLRSLIANQKTCIPAQDFEKYGDWDLAFHRCIREASGNARLVKTSEAFDGQIRLLIDKSTRTRKLPTSVQEHRAIADAIAAKDPIEAEVAMRHHVREAGNALKSHFQPSGESKQTSVHPSIAQK